jgi:hypothetical protein
MNRPASDPFDTEIDPETQVWMDGSGIHVRSAKKPIATVEECQQRLANLSFEELTELFIFLLAKSEKGTPNEVDG